MMLIFAIACCGALTLTAVVVGAALPRSGVGRQIATLEAAAPRTAREPELWSRLMGSELRAKLLGRFAEAGWYRTPVSRFCGGALLSLVTAAGIGGAVVAVLGISGPLGIAAVALVLAAGALLPFAVLAHAVDERKTAIARTLPDWLDIVSAQVEAGNALNAALLTSVDAVRGPLAEELREMLADVRLGRSRADALSAMAARVRQIDLTTTVVAIVQNERLGGNIAHLLDELAAEARHRRLMRAEERAARLPVQMVLPMALFMLPALLVMIFGPVLSDLMESFK